MCAMQVVTTIGAYRKVRAAMRGRGARVGFVPTMGALHEGHLSLVECAKELTDEVVVSIFVNPTQFAPHEDLAKYPRPIERDLRMCEQAGVAAVFNPGVEEMYPAGQAEAMIDVPAISAILEGESRPQFFGGVCRVVAKLFNIVQPDVACFGMKDYQQWCVVKAMTRSMCWPIEIVGCETMRESDGLAMSSRNVYLDGGQRKRALGLSRALGEANRLIEAGERDAAAIEDAMTHMLTEHRLRVDYAAVRRRDLQPGEVDFEKGVVCLIAAWCDPVRLIDNMEINADTSGNTSGNTSGG
ncbi:MAG: pantoate--beta-alanine ligase [Phycisphaerales bacterium]